MSIVTSKKHYRETGICPICHNTSDMREQIATLQTQRDDLETKNNNLKERLEAVEQLNACYRLGKHPTEKLLATLDKTKKKLDK